MVKLWNRGTPKIAESLSLVDSGASMLGARYCLLTIPSLSPPILPQPRFQSQVSFPHPSRNFLTRWGRKRRDSCEVFQFSPCPAFFLVDLFARCSFLLQHDLHLFNLGTNCMYLCTWVEWAFSCWKMSNCCKTHAKLTILPFFCRYNCSSLLLTLAVSLA